MKIKDIISCLNHFAPLSFQESYDNSGLIIGDLNAEAKGALLTLDTLEATIDEAIEKGANLVISHHPLIFSGLKSITGKNYIERTALKAIKNDIAIYAGHTNFDSAPNGVNAKLAEKIGLKDTKFLVPLADHLLKLVVFIPADHLYKVRNAIFEAGAGHIGNYDCCSFNLNGEGTFRALEGTQPFVGKQGELHTEKEIRLETILPKHLKGAVLNALLSTHPYEEVAYDLYPITNNYEKAGAGMIGYIEKELNGEEFLNDLKKKLGLKIIRHTEITEKKVKKVALCGGSGSHLLRNAIQANADIFISGDFKYHQFFDAENKILIADIGHYESEIFTLEVFYDLVMKNFPNFAVHLSEINSNPINYY